MKKNIIYLIIGAFIGIMSTTLYYNYKKNDINNPKRKREAILFAQKKVKEKYNREDSPLIFPLVADTKLEVTEYGTYLIRFKANFKGGRWIKDQYNSSGGKTLKRDAIFIVETKFENGKWKLIEMEMKTY